MLNVNEMCHTFYPIFPTFITTYDVLKKATNRSQIIEQIDDFRLFDEWKIEHDYQYRKYEHELHVHDIIN